MTGKKRVKLLKFSNKGPGTTDTTCYLYESSSDDFACWHFVTLFNPLYTSVCKICTLTNSEDPDEIPHNMAFHQVLNCLLR